MGDLEVRHGEARVNGIRMHFVEKGQGPLVVLLHGFPETWWSWRHQIGPLAAAGHRVVVPDLRGYGDTDQHGPYDLDTLAADVRGLIGAVGGGAPAAVVGHDWGGATAWHLASVAPEVMTRLAVVNCPHPAMMARALRKSWRQIKKSWYMFLFLVPRWPERMLTQGGAVRIRRILRGNAHDRTNFGDEEIAPFRDNALKPGAARAMLGYYRAALRAALRPRRYPRIALETLLIWGLADGALEFDDLVPGTERWVPRLRTTTIDGCGHFAQSERPDVVNAKLLQFLA